MDYPDPRPNTDVDILMLALHRADQNWPNRADLEQYWEEHEYLRPFGSIEQAEAAIQKFHERDSAELSIRQIGWNLREKAIESFLRAHASSTESFEQGRAKHIINLLISTSSFTGLELFLGDILQNGVEKAVKQYQTVDRGNKYGHIFVGLLALLEISVLLIVLNACQHGFQTMVLCGIGLIYSVIAFQGLASNDFDVRRFATVVRETSRIRYLLKDRGFRREEAEEDFIQLDRILAKSQVRYWVAGVKFLIIDLICLIGLVWSAL